MNHMIVKVKVNAGIEVMKPVLSKNDVEVRKVVNNHKAPCEMVSSMFTTDGSDCFCLTRRVRLVKPLHRGSDDVELNLNFWDLT